MAKAVAEQGSGKLFMELATVTVIYYTWAFICGCKSYRYTDQSFTSEVHNAASYLVVWFMPVLISVYHSFSTDVNDECTC